MDDLDAAPAELDLGTVAALAAAVASTPVVAPAVISVVAPAAVIVAVIVAPAAVVVATVLGMGRGRGEAEPVLPELEAKRACREQRAGGEGCGQPAAK